MAWIESHTVLIRHRKTVSFALELKIEPVMAVGLLHTLWHSALEQAEDGDLSGWNDQFIAAAAQWKGDPGAFCRALRGNGWLDGHLLHDWLDYAGRYLKSRYATSNPQRLKEIEKKHKRNGSKTKVILKIPHQPNLTNQPNQPNLPTPTQVADLLVKFPLKTQEKIKVYWDRVRCKNKSKVITEGRKLTLLTELYNTMGRCNNIEVFNYGLEESIGRDACNIGYVNAVIKNKLTKK